MCSSVQYLHSNLDLIILKVIIHIFSWRFNCKKKREHGPCLQTEWQNYSFNHVLALDAFYTKLLLFHMNLYVISENTVWPNVISGLILLTFKSEFLGECSPDIQVFHSI